MAHVPPNYRQPPFQNRPWITGDLYEKYSQPTIMHCDAYVFTAYGRPHLLIDWHEGGRKLIARDGFLIEPDGVIAIWDVQPPLRSARIYWTAANSAAFARLHAFVLSQGPRMLGLGRGKWTRVVMQAHYIYVRETDCEIPPAKNKYVERKPYATRSLADLHAQPGTIGPEKKRGRPRTKLPDWL